MKYYSIHIVALLLVVCLSAGCAQRNMASTVGMVQTNALLEYFRDSNLTVSPRGTMRQDYFTVQGNIYLVQNDEVQIYEFENEQAAAAEASDIPPSGRPIISRNPAKVSIRFYEGSGLIVIHLGSSPDVERALREQFGSDFARRS